MIGVHQVEISPQLEDVLDRPLWSGIAGRRNRFTQLARHALETIDNEGLLDPQIALGVFPLQSLGADRLCLEEAGVLEVNSFALPEEGFSYAASAVGTIGGGCEERASAQLGCGKRLEALIWDSIGNAAVELLVQEIRELVRNIAAGARMSAGPVLIPGMPGFGLDQQARLCEMAEAERIGVQVSSTGMLHPVKSASLLIPLGEDLQDCEDLHLCESCHMAEFCLFKRHERR